MASPKHRRHPPADRRRADRVGHPLPPSSTPHGHDCGNCWARCRRWFRGLRAAATLGVMVKRSREAETLLAELDSELARSSETAGVTLSWTPAERQHLDMIADTIDRRTHLQGRYNNTDPLDAKNLCRYSTEIRLCDALVSRLLQRVSTDVAPPMGQRSRRAQHAALSRWAKDRGAAS